MANIFFPAVGNTWTKVYPFNDVITFFMNRSMQQIWVVKLCFAFANVKAPTKTTTNAQPEIMSVS